MKKYNKIILLIIMLYIPIFLFGCKKDKTVIKDDFDNQIIENNNELVPDKEKDNDEKENVIDKNNNGESNENDIDDPFDTNVEPVVNKELPIYAIDIDSGEMISVISMITENIEITPELIVDKVVEAMEDLSVFIGIDGVDIEDDIVIVNFKADTPPVNNVGSGIEGSILNAIAQSLIDNLEDYNKVIFRIENEAYTTGHIELGYDEIFLSK
ncbi:MAG TPA: hypothetical protein GXZ90_03320 [Clostridiales bacterium]|nr:hypothetical protein [Clostridiales bacterium]